jgi:hypothetical protein
MADTLSAIRPQPAIGPMEIRLLRLALGCRAHHGFLLDKGVKKGQNWLHPLRSPIVIKSDGWK